MTFEDALISSQSRFSKIFKASRRRHISTHQLESHRFLVESFLHSLVWFLENVHAWKWGTPALPVIWNGRITPPHRLFEVGAGNFGEQVFGKVNPQVSVANKDVAEAETESQVSISVRNYVSYRGEEAVKGVSYKTHTQRNWLSNGDWIRIDHSESFLEGRSLTCCRRNLFLSFVSDQVCLQMRVNHKAGSHLVNMFALALGFRISRLHWVSTTADFW